MQTSNYNYRFILAFVALFFTIAILHAQVKQTSGNPVFKGWYADPEAAVFNNEYWIYPTYSDKYEKQVFFDAFSSPDLVHWAKHEKVLDTLNVKWAKRAVWAPALVKKDNKYYLFFGANDIQNDSASGGIGVAVADKPEGPFKDYLGKPLVDKFIMVHNQLTSLFFMIKTGNII